MLWFGICAAICAGSLVNSLVDDVTLQITVVDEAGGVIPNVPVCAVGHVEPPKPFAGCGWTDGLGKVEIHLQRSVDGYVFMLSPSMPSSLDAPFAGSKRYNQLLREYAEPGKLWIDDLAGQTLLTKTLVLEKGAAVRGTIVGPNGAHASTFVSVLESRAFCESNESDGHFELIGVPANQSVLLAIHAPDSFLEFKYLECVVPPAVDSVDLGTITCEAKSTDYGKVAIQSSGSVGVHEQVMYGCGDRVTLVRKDGSRGIRSPQLSLSGGVSKEFNVPTGTYFVVPGTAHANKMVAELVRRLKAGAAADVMTSGAFQKVTVTTGAHAVVEIEWRSAINQGVAYLGGR